MTVLKQILSKINSRRRPKAVLYDQSNERDTFDVPGASEPMFGFGIGPTTLVNVHTQDQCSGEHCVIHNPSDHHMKDWPLHWRGDKKEMERTCPHGVGHPDPDDVAHQKRIRPKYVDGHGCDGCCRTPLPVVESTGPFSRGEWGD